jgi:hypothetical protein
MNLQEILKELPNLTREEREKILEQIVALDMETDRDATPAKPGPS